MTAAIDSERSEYFDETDGAYATAEPDPFADEHDPRQPTGPASPRPSLRAELGRLTAPRLAVSQLTKPALPPLPVPADLESILPEGLRRGSTIAVTSSVSLLLALLGGPSANGAWAALIGLPAISAEAAAEAGINLDRLAIIGSPEGGWTSAAWTTAVGALLDAVDVVAARPGVIGGVGIKDGDARRLTARARTKDSVLMLFGQRSVTWPAVSVELSAQHSHWTGIGDGYGRLTSRQLTVSATGKGRSGRARAAQLSLPVSLPLRSVSAGSDPLASPQPKSQPSQQATA
jgi:hypothetical protein